LADKQSELRELKRMGAVPQKNSGRGKHDKGDGILAGIWMVDVKEYAKSYSLSIDGWAKTCTDAFRAGQKEPLLLVVLGEGKDRIRLVVHSLSDFESMKDMIGEIEMLKENINYLEDEVANNTYARD
jgi:hypothetical protein